MEPWPLIVNPMSGGGRGRAAEALLRSFAERHGGELHFTEREGQGTDLARLAAEAGVEQIVVGGGDDTVREILTGILHLQTPPTLGILPLGTYNNFSRTLQLPLDPSQALEIALHGHALPVDLGQVEGRIFTESIGVGFEAEAWTHKPDVEPVGLGRLVRGASIALETLGSFAARQFYLTVDGQEEVVRAMNITVANTPEFAAQVATAPQASLSDGLLDVCVIKEMSSIEFLAAVPLIVSGLHPFLMTSVHYEQGQEVTLAADEALPVRVDGSIDMRLPVRVKILPGRIMVRVPQTQWP
ncbi:MAG: diacylglycerol kinase family protein [Candidatus Eremiobacterota bacterium]